MATGDTSHITHTHIDVGTTTLHLAEQGSGPLVVLLHGFPESWYSWRHQFNALARAGYRVAAPDQRGYGSSHSPKNIEDYTLPHLVGDLIGLIKALGEEQATVVGHDWGAPVAWAGALMRPDMVRAVAGLSVPPAPPAFMPPPSTTRRLYGEGFYQIRFQEPGVVDAELAADPAATLRRFLVAASGDNPNVSEPAPWVVPEGMQVLGTMPEPRSLPQWLDTEDIDTFAADYAHHQERAFTGPLNWYRNIERNQHLMSPFVGRTIDVPALYMVGDLDMVTALHGVDRLRQSLHLIAPQLHAQHTLAGCGHWTQQERPEQVNEALLDFLAHAHT